MTATSPTTRRWCSPPTVRIQTSSTPSRAPRSLRLLRRRTRRQRRRPRRPSPPPRCRFKQKHRIETAEKDVEKARAALELLDRDLGDPDTFTHKADAEAKLKARAKLQSQLDAAEAEWLEALEDVG